MSRVIVKGLPLYADERRLREHLGGIGLLTDVKVVRTRCGAGATGRCGCRAPRLPRCTPRARRHCRDGKSRCFGFVGFKDEAAAQRAVDMFNRSFMDTSRLQVELAKGVRVRPRHGPRSQRV